MSSLASLLHPRFTTFNQVQHCESLRRFDDSATFLFGVSTMFRRNNRSFFSSASRRTRRAAKAQLRANRSNALFMKRYDAHVARITRLRKAFPRFVPMNLSRFRAAWSVFSSMVAGLWSGKTFWSNDSLASRTAMASRRGVFGLGGKKNRSKTRGGRNKRAEQRSKAASSNSYESLEPRQLLAADLLVSLDTTDPTNSCLLYTSRSPRDQRGSRMPTSA